jgi:hypothetical protein
LGEWPLNFPHLLRSQTELVARCTIISCTFKKKKKGLPFKLGQPLLIRHTPISEMSKCERKRSTLEIMIQVLLSLLSVICTEFAEEDWKEEKCQFLWDGKVEHFRRKQKLRLQGYMTCPKDRIKS